MKTTIPVDISNQLMDISEFANRSRVRWNRDSGHRPYRHTDATKRNEAVRSVRSDLVDLEAMIANTRKLLDALDTSEVDAVS